MTGQGQTPSGSNPSALIISTALLVGGVSFAVGFLGPALFSGANLGPLLGIFVTGPLGGLAGALIGLVYTALQAEQRSLRPEIRWLIGCWVLALGYVWITLGLSSVWLAAPPLVMVLAAGGVLLINTSSRRKLSEPWRRTGPLMLGAGLVMLLLTIVPPVTQPSWQSRRDAARTKAAFPQGLPRRALLTDSHFDSSRHVPDFTINGLRLLVEWAAVAAVTAGVSLLLVRTSRQP